MNSLQETNRKTYVRAYYLANKVRILAKQKLRHEQCRESLKIYARTWRQNNKARIRGYRDDRIKAIRDAKTKPCLDCHIMYPSYIMQFDHREPSYKNFNIGGSWCSRTLKSILSEIDKCDVVCANCHAKRTHKRGYFGI